MLNLWDTRIYVTADHDICLERRVFRDVRERGRTEESVRAQYQETVRPMCDRYVAPTQAHADVVLPGSAELKQSVYSILNRLAQRLTDTARQRRSTIAYRLGSRRRPKIPAAEHPQL